MYYDTIVLDIDFENGVIDASNIVEKLTKLGADIKLV